LQRGADIVTTTLNHKEAAALIGVKPDTLKFWRCKGKGPRFIKLGSSIRAGVVYDAADIDAWKAARKFASTSAVTVQHPDHPRSIAS
jgi:predicted DNA-binding transcriptional regulator AlpA